MFHFEMIRWQNPKVYKNNVNVFVDFWNNIICITDFGLGVDYKFHVNVKR